MVLHVCDTVSYIIRAPDKVCKMNFNLLDLRHCFTKSMFDHLLELSHRDDSNNLSNIGFVKK